MTSEDDHDYRCSDFVRNVCAALDRLGIAYGPLGRNIGRVFLVVVMVSITWKERHNLADLMLTAGGSTLVLCMVSYGYGLLSAKLGKLSTRQMSSVCIEVGMQNSTLAMVITLSFLENSRMAIPPMVYSIMMFAVGWVLVAWFHRLNKNALHQA